MMMSCYGLNRVAPNSYVQVTPVLQNTTLFEDQVFKEVINL